MSTLTPENYCAPSPTIPSPLPSGTDGKLIKVSPSAMCSMGWRTILITGLLRDMLIRHFAEPLNIEEPDLRHLVWRQDERTGILIESIHRWRGELVEKRPAVIIKPNGRQNIRWGIQDYAGVTEQGFVQYRSFWAGSHTVFCIHGSGASTEILATEVQRDLLQWHPIITGLLGLHKWQVTEVGGISEIEEAKEGFVVPVTVGWVYEEKWEIQPESLKLRKVPLATWLDGALIQESN